MFRLFAASAFLFLAACGPDRSGENAVTPQLSQMTEDPGDWSAVQKMVGRTPADSSLLDNSPVAVDVAAKLGPDFAAYRSAMMQAGPLRREGNLLVARAPDAWLVLQPGDHAMRLALRTRSGWREWQTAGANVPAPAG